MGVRLYAFFSAQLVRMTTTRNAVRQALANLVSAHLNLEHTNIARNRLKTAINRHLNTTINRNKAINEVLKSSGYKYPNANRPNIIKKVGIRVNGNNLHLNLKPLTNSYYNINGMNIKRRARGSRVLSIMQARPVGPARILIGRRRGANAGGSVSGGSVQLGGGGSVSGGSVYFGGGGSSSRSMVRAASNI